MLPDYFKQSATQWSSVWIDACPCSFIWRHEYLSATWSGIWHYTAPAGNFLDKLTFEPLPWGKGRMFIAPLKSLICQWPKIAPEAIVLGSSPREAEHLLFWGIPLCDENTCYCLERKNTVYFIRAVGKFNYMCWQLQYFYENVYMKCNILSIVY